LYLIVGLGNPGARYHNTRHNAGFLVVDKLAEFFKIDTFELENNYLYAVTEIKQDLKQDIDTAAQETGNVTQLVLMKPLTYMNLSGEAVKYFYDKYEIEKENILIIYDDVNIDLGVLRMRPSGSDGGQNGIKSIIYNMETDEIPRLRFGIKGGEEYEKLRLSEDFSLADYVLSPFEDKELDLLDKSADRAKDAVISFVNNGIKETMNLYNGRIPEEEN
jgi:PTH1 family peptidyl-tRNA hydrolase